MEILAWRRNQGQRKSLGGPGHWRAWTVVEVAKGKKGIEEISWKKEQLLKNKSDDCVEGWV